MQAASGVTWHLPWLLSCVSLLLVSLLAVSNQHGQGRTFAIIVKLKAHHALVRNVYSHTHVAAHGLELHAASGA